LLMKTRPQAKKITEGVEAESSEGGSTIVDSGGARENEIRSLLEEATSKTIKE